MISPEWFFSTLAQVSATIIGFILAFSAILHQLDRRERNRSTERLRDELIGLKEKYQRVLFALNDLFAEIEGDETLKEYIRNQESDADELLDKFQENEDIDFPHTSLLWMLFRRVLLYLDRINPDSDPSRDYLLTAEQFNYLMAVVQELYNKLTDDDFVNELWKELNPGYEKRIKQRNISDIVGLFENQRLNNRESAFTEETYAEEIRNWLMSETDHQIESLYSGKNIRSWSFVVGMFLNEFQKADAHKANTWIDYDPLEIRDIILASATFTLIGVFIPILFLINPLDMFPIIAGIGLTLVQSLIIVITVILSGYLFLKIYQNLSSNWS